MARVEVGFRRIDGFTDFSLLFGLLQLKRRRMKLIAISTDKTIVIVNSIYDLGFWFVNNTNIFFTTQIGD